MAGGKETPRQKMIGMMYLVLTALLALNVSKQILDAFVAIEENIQRGTITQLEKGNGNRDELKTEMSQSTKDEAGQAKKAKIKIYLDIINQIDSETGKVIGLIDEIKMLLLEKAKEKVAVVKDNDEKTVVWKKYDKSDPIRPARLNLMAVQAKDQFDIPMHEIVGSDIKRLDPSKEGIKLWKAYNNYRARLVELTGSYKEGERKFSVKTKPINKFSSNADLDKQVRAMITGGGNKVNKEDVEMLVGIYEELTKQEIANHHEQKDIHWMGRTFDHAPLVGAIASLSSLQNEILSARAKAIGLLKSKVTTGQFSFNKIVGMGFTDGTVFQQGDEVTLSVFMGAFDSDKQPQVKPDQGSLIESKNGIAKIRVTAPAPGQELKLTGSVAVADKNGTLVWRDYGKDADNEIKIMSVKPGGSLEMPEYMVLYRGYDNKIIPAASGVVSFDINVAGCPKVPTTIDGKKGYILKPGPGVKSVVVNLTGKDAKGKSLPFGKWTYTVKPFPNPEIKTMSVSKSSGARINVGLPADSPLKSPAFQVLAVEVLGVDNGQCSGGNIPGNIVTKLKAGKSIGINVTVKNPLTGSTVIIPGALKVTN
jgi:hypothetical protein